MSKFAVNDSVIRVGDIVGITGTVTEVIPDGIVVKFPTYLSSYDYRYTHPEAKQYLRKIPSKSR
jgi:hypothetical protein